MKKTAIIVLSVIMVICLAIVGAFAADRDRKREHVEEFTKTCETQNCTVDRNKNCESKNYADENSDGICDNYAENCKNVNENGNNYVDEDNDGVCDNYSGTCNSSDVNGKNYVDEDNNGVCDNYAENCNNTNDNNYVDTDGDGVCDNYSSGKHNQNGKHCKNRCN